MFSAYRSHATAISLTTWVGGAQLSTPGSKCKALTTWTNFLVKKMGKEKKAKRHQSLAQQILDGDAPRQVQRAKLKREQSSQEPGFVEGSLSHKILAQARAQQDELEEQHGYAATTGRKKKRRTSASAAHRLTLPGSTVAKDSDDDVISDVESDGEYAIVEGTDSAPVVQVK